MEKNSTTVVTAPIDSSWSNRAKAVGPPILLTAWTLVVWVGRIRNVLVDDDLSGFDRAWRLALAATFVALAGAVGVSMARFTLLARARAYGLVRRTVTALAWFGIVVWPIRAITILVSTYDAGFKIVHTVLAAITIGLGALVLRWVAATR